MNMSRIAAVGLLVASLCTGVARADIIGVGGSAVVQVPPADIRLHHWESSSEARVWAEQVVTLASSLDLDAVNTGLIDEPSDAITGQVSAGMTVASYMLRADPLQQISVTLNGFVQFDQPILGVLFLRSTLNDSDGLLALPGVMYNQNQQRGADLADPSEPDFFTISPDRTRIDFSYAVGGWTDDIRIVTAVPAPGGVMTLAVGILGMIPRRRRR